jgi:aspartyl-tRNA synthetase
VIAAIGTVKRRDADTINPNIPTGEVELVVEELRILNVSKPLPFLPSDTVLANEEMRLKYRYIDLRRDAMQFNIELRHKVALAIRDNLASRGFFEIETPFMTRSTPEGARDYLVPSRVQPGSFYALPQSPQLFKQILMISGFDKYFQIVRCFRDEDLRADRQPEFTQIDLEMSYPQPERVWEVVEGFLTAAFKTAGHEITTPFPRMDFDDAIRQYGVDKPDLRLPAFVDVRTAFDLDQRERLKLSADDLILQIRIPGVGHLSGTERKRITESIKQAAKLRPFDYNSLQKDTAFSMATQRLDHLYNESIAPGNVNEGFSRDDASDLVLLVATPRTAVQGTAAGRAVGKVSAQDAAFYKAAGQLRIEIAKTYAEKHGAFRKTGDAAKDFRFLWVTNFPMFEYDEGDQRWMAAHHPFTSPHEEDMDKLETDPAMVRALAYDVVLNGTELGSGSIRIHRQDVQSRIFHALGMTEEEARSRFGFFLEALEYGTPPHGGIALGLDRIVMILAGADSLREVIPFPKTAAAKDLMMEAPTPVAEGQLRELGIGVVKRPL